MHEGETDRVEGQIECSIVLYYKMRDIIVESTVEGEYYKLVHGIQEMRGVIGKREIGKLRKD